MLQPQVEIDFDNNERNVVCEVTLIEQGQYAAHQPDQNESNNTPQCPYCNSVARQFVGTKDFNRRTTDLTFQYFQCQKCGLVFMDPIPVDMRPFYEGGYQKIPNTLSELRAIAETEKYRMKPILKYKNEGRLLEIGPWMGIFSCNAKDAGFDVTAIDIDENCINFLNNVVGIRALQSSDPAETLGQMKEKFDVIAMWHCLEHLPNPWTLIQRAAERLAPGGVLLVAIPNIESYEFSALGATWKHLDAPRHLYFYPAKSLVTLCRVNGLKEVELTTTDELSNALSRDAWYSWASARIPLKYVRSVIGLLTYFYARNRAKKKPACGSGLTAVFQCPHVVAPPGLSSL
jgi:2-polyprenyl-3-methyl-5-hydroxy-6-metoxy-1,4-benzoquinol methylase